ncbi:MAG: trypsin-like peptidase domain-containing protein [Caldilinea sp.]|nr:trypsin-like peptidase domain-containing protein [Caldilinea sp.]MCB0057819.1 trypsin-like peptidase domain-containing protein [Caldilineaceae bacterium]MCB9140663.1 trypsin-like peptidase domain-containing protein [Anaerolineales bacterium]MCB0038031.1 trypsin-like peptidase domain-containing protein [Caldilinea sp.]MCB0049989.1 trypsin-like peptidase domain-containing protein [Caldilinea sp.]
MSSVCPKCRAANRGGARFCARCGAALTPPGQMAAAPGAGALASTTKICPRCHTPTPIATHRCSHCGYTFATSVSLRTYWLTRLAILGGALVVVLLAVIVVRGWLASSTPGDLATPLNADAALQRAIQATVQVLTPQDDDSDVLSTGSGTVVNGERGFILTNFHVVGDPDTGHYANASRTAWIALSPNGSLQPPEVRYRAEVVDADPALDLALLRIVADADGNRTSDNLNLVAITVGDSATVQIGDPVTVLGYPGLGGDTITLTRGTVSGFVEGWIKTDAETNPGNSGGAAINTAGELVGVPSAGYLESSEVDSRLPGKLGLIRPVNAAQALLREAR